MHSIVYVALLRWLYCTYLISTIRLAHPQVFAVNDSQMKNPPHVSETIKPIKWYTIDLNNYKKQIKFLWLIMTKN